MEKQWPFILVDETFLLSPSSFIQGITPGVDEVAGGASGIEGKMSSDMENRGREDDQY